MMKDATSDDLLYLNQLTNNSNNNNTSNNNNSMNCPNNNNENNTSEIGKLQKLPGYNKLRKQLFYNLMTASPDITHQNIRVTLTKAEKKQEEMENLSPRFHHHQNDRENEFNNNNNSNNEKEHEFFDNNSSVMSYQLQKHKQQLKQQSKTLNSDDEDDDNDLNTSHNSNEDNIFHNNKTSNIAIDRKTIKNISKLIINKIQLQEKKERAIKIQQLRLAIIEADTGFDLPDELELEDEFYRKDSIRIKSAEPKSRRTSTMNE